MSPSNIHMCFVHHEGHLQWQEEKVPWGSDRKVMYLHRPFLHLVTAETPMHNGSGVQRTQQRQSKPSSGRKARTCPRGRDVQGHVSWKWQNSFPRGKNASGERALSSAGWHRCCYCTVLRNQASGAGNKHAWQGVPPLRIVHIVWNVHAQVFITECPWRGNKATLQAQTKNPTYPRSEWRPSHHFHRRHIIQRYLGDICRHTEELSGHWAWCSGIPLGVFLDEEDVGSQWMDVHGW